MLTGLIVVIISQYVHISKHYVVHQKLVQHTPTLSRLKKQPPQKKQPLHHKSNGKDGIMGEAENCGRKIEL